MAGVKLTINSLTIFWIIVDCCEALCFIAATNTTFACTALIQNCLR